MASEAQPRKVKTIREAIKKNVKDELILPHLLGPDTPKRQLLFKIFDTTKGPDDKANERNLDNVMDAGIRFKEYRLTEIHFEHHNLSRGSSIGNMTGGNSVAGLLQERDPSFDSTSDAPQPRPYCFGCNSSFHPFTSDHLTSIFPLKRFLSTDASMKACSRCKVVTYCSPECQTKDWEGKVRRDFDGKKCVSHRKICKSIIRDFDASVKTVISDQSLDLPKDPINMTREQIEAMYRQRIMTWAKLHHELILIMARKALDKPIFEWLPEANVTTITLREDDRHSPYGAIASGAREESPQPEIVYLPSNLFNPNITPTPAAQQAILAQFRYKSSIFHIVRVSRCGLSILDVYFKHQSPVPSRNTSNPDFDPQELINIGYHPVLIIANLSQGGKSCHLEHVKISEIMDCDDLDYFPVSRFVALANRGNFVTLQYTRQVMEEG